MTAPPIPLQYSGEGVFVATRAGLKLCEEHFGEGEIVLMGQVEERSEVSHRHEFAWLREAWATLPEHLANEYPTAEHLRKKALIATGWRIVRDYPVANRKEAVRLAAALEAETDEYTVVLIEDAVVRVCRAKSQSRNKMKAADFTASKNDVLGWVAALLEVEPEVLSSQGAGGANNPARVAA